MRYKYWHHPGRVRAWGTDRAMLGSCYGTRHPAQEGTADGKMHSRFGDISAPELIQPRPISLRGKCLTHSRKLLQTNTK